MLHTRKTNNKIGAVGFQYYIPSQTLLRGDFRLSSEEQGVRLLSMGILPGTLCFLLRMKDKRELLILAYPDL